VPGTAVLSRAWPTELIIYRSRPWIAAGYGRDELTADRVLPVRVGERGQRRPRVRADLAHPPGHSVPEADHQAAGVQLSYRGDLHRGERGIAGHRRHDAQAHDQPAGAG
jgi:hypothetical protein